MPSNKSNTKEILINVKSAIDTGFDKTLDVLKELQTVTASLTESINKMTSAFSGSSDAVNKMSASFKKSAKAMIADIDGSIKEINSSMDEFKSKFNVDEIREQLDKLANVGVNSKGFRTELRGIEKEIEKVNNTITTTTKELSNLESKFKKGEIKESEFNSQTKKLNKTLDDSKVKVKDLGNRLRDLKEGIGEAAENAKNADDIFAGLSTRFKVFWQYRAINAMSNALYNLSKVAIDLEASFANIQAITSASDGEMEKLRNTILKVGEASKYSTEEIANATVTLGQAGLSADEINNVLETTTQLAAATGSSLQNTVDLMTSALAVWGLNSEEASHLSDVMVTGMNRTKATLETFRMAVQYAGATMASLNVSFDEFASVAAAASNAGLRASVVGTGLRAVTSELISPTTKMVKGLSQLGLSTEDVNIESQGLVNVLYKLKNAGLDASNAYDLFGRRAAQFILAAQGQLDVVDELQVAFNESGATLKAYGTQMDTVAAQWTALGNTMKEVASNVLDSVSWMIKDTLRFLNDAIQGYIWLFSDKQKYAFNELNERLKDEELSAKSFYEFVNKLSERDYGDDTYNAVKDLNEVVDKLNEKFGTTIAYVDGLEDIADAFERIKTEIRNIDDKKIRDLNVEREKQKNYLLSQVTPSPSLELSGGSRAWDIQNYTRLYLYKLESSKGKSKDIENEINKLSDEFEKKLKEEALNKAKEIFESLPDRAKSNRRSNFLDDELKELKSLNKENEATLNQYIEDVSNNVESFNYNVSDIINHANSIIKEYDVKLSDENKELIKELLPKGEEQAELINSIKKAKKNTVNGFISLFEQIKTVIEQQLGSDISSSVRISLVNQLGEVESILSDYKTLDSTPLDKGISKLKTESKIYRLKKKQDREDRRTAREIEREKAREFNKRYQELQLQAKADAYAQKSAEARREGVTSKLNTRDTTGTLASYYSSTAADLSKLESLRTAISNKETLDRYKKDYGDLFEQVKSGKVTLEDAQNKTSGLINEMMELDTNVQKAEAEFGNLNDIDLSDLNGQITTLQNKLQEIEESSETEFGKLKEGFKATIESMAKGYGSAKLGSMIAEDFGNGMADALNSIVDGSKSAKEAFSDMARSILEDISKMLIKMAVMKVMMAAFGGTNQVYSAPIGPTQTSINGFNGLKEGGFIPKIRAAAGTVVRGGIQGKDSVPAMLMPGEYVLKKSAVDALGTNFLNDLNNNAAQTLTKTANDLIGKEREEDDSEPAVVNVWVVSKEEEAKMGPNDVIATISKDIMTGGTTRRLIQQVVAGRK